MSGILIPAVSGIQVNTLPDLSWNLRGNDLTDIVRCFDLKKNCNELLILQKLQRFRITLIKPENKVKKEQKNFVFSGCYKNPCLFLLRSYTSSLNWLLSCFLNAFSYTREYDVRKRKHKKGRKGGNKLVCTRNNFRNKKHGNQDYC